MKMECYKNDAHRPHGDADAFILMSATGRALQDVPGLVFSPAYFWNKVKQFHTKKLEKLQILNLYFKHQQNR